MPAAYPLLLDVTAVRIVVVGGGPVARRKVLGLLQAGAVDVTVVSPMLTADFPTVRHVAARYTPQVISGARLIFAATNDPQTNAGIVADARAAGAWASRADLAEGGDVVTPAVFRDGPVTISVTAGSAALAAFIRDGLGERVDPRWAKMADAMTILRPMLRARLTPPRRSAAFRRLASEDALAVLDRDGTVGLIAWLDAET